MSSLYDVIVIGAGPAGATLAFELARLGYQILIIEKEILPRYKCCGGGLTGKTVSLLDSLKLDIKNVIEDTVSNVIIQYNNKTHELKENFPLMYTVSRDRFDHLLVKKAETSGAEVLHGIRALGIIEEEQEVKLVTDNKTFRSRFLVGADGANSITRGVIKSGIGYNRIIGIESEINVPRYDLLNWRSRVLLQLGRTKAGYAWIFPKADHLSIGIGCIERYARNIKFQYGNFLKSLNFSVQSVTRFQGNIIPLCAEDNTFSKGRVLLVGDAAGLADPLTGEGIYNAIKSALLASDVLKQSLSDDSSVDEYTHLVEEIMMPGIHAANIFSKILTLVPQRLFGMLEHDDRVWHGCRGLLCGEIQYTDIMSRLNNLGGMYNFVFRR